MCGHPIVCPPQYCVRDFVTPHVVPVIHPVVNVNRQHIVGVPQHYYQPYTANLLVNHGFQGGYGGYGGYGNRLFF